MNGFERFVHFFQGEMTTPTDFSWFHLMFIGIVLALTITFCITLKDCKDKTLRLIVLITWIVITVLEIYKQIVFTLDVENGVASWTYEWYAFPFQFCSTPLYVLPFIAFLKEGKVRDAFIAYMGTFSLFAGLAVFVIPGNVFIGMIGINIQTMVHHGSQIFIGIFLMVHERKKLNWKLHLTAIPVFAGFATIALILNEIVHAVFVANSINQDFNMFYFSRHYECALPLLGDIQDHVNEWLFIVIYILGFVLVSAIVFYAQFGIVKLVAFCQKKAKEKKELAEACATASEVENKG